VEPAGRQLATCKLLVDDPEVRAYILKSDQLLEQIGYTEHGMRHACLVSRIAGNVLGKLEYPERRCELARIAGLLHDIGNFMGRRAHTATGPVVAFSILTRLGMDPGEIADVCTAIGHHEELDMFPTLDVAAALTLADKSDVHRTRVRAPIDRFDIHDRVNDAAESSFLRVDLEQRTISLEIAIDTAKGSVMEYFEIFLERMIMCRAAGKALNCTFGLYINDTKLQ